MSHLRSIRWPLWGLRQLWPTSPDECALARLGTDLPLHGDRHMRGEEMIVNPTGYTSGLPAVEHFCSSCSRRGLDGLRSLTCMIYIWTGVQLHIYLTPDDQTWPPIQISCLPAQKLKIRVQGLSRNVRQTGPAPPARWAACNEPALHRAHDFSRAPA